MSKKSAESWGRPLEDVNICKLCANECKEYDVDKSECSKFVPKENINLETKNENK